VTDICKSGKIGNGFSFLILANNKEFDITLTTPTEQYKNKTTSSIFAELWIEQKINTLNNEQRE
jgi:hypothetical protein